MRIQGRNLRAIDLRERRVLKALGTDVLRVPRKYNPFAVARQIRKIATGQGSGLAELRAMVTKAPTSPSLPDSTSETEHETCAA